MGEDAARRALLATRAHVLREWTGQDSYRLHQHLVQALWDKEMAALLRGTAAEFDERKGYLRALTDVLGLAERAIFEQQRETAAA